MKYRVLLSGNWVRLLRKLITREHMYVHMYSFMCDSVVYMDDIGRSVTEAYLPGVVRWDSRDVRL